MTQGHPFPIIPITVPPFPPQLLALLLLPTQTYWEASSETTPVMLLGPSLPRLGILPRSLPSPLIRAPPSRPAAAHSGVLGGVTWDRPGHATRAFRPYHRHITTVPPFSPHPSAPPPPCCCPLRRTGRRHMGPPRSCYSGPKGISFMLDPIYHDPNDPAWWKFLVRGCTRGKGGGMGL